MMPRTFPDCTGGCSSRPDPLRLRSVGSRRFVSSAGRIIPFVTDEQPTTPGRDDEARDDDVSGEGVDDETATLDEVEPPPESR
jgi:hypothetical protein